MKNNSFIYIALLIVIIWLTALTTGNISSNQAAISASEVTDIYHVSGFSTDFTEVYESCRSAIVSIECGDNLLTGFIYKQEGNDVYVITASHGLTSEFVNVHFASSYSAYASIVKADVYSDVALLKVETPYEMNLLKLGNSSLLKAGEYVLDIGTAKNLDYAYSCEMGMVSAPLRTINNSITYENETSVYYLDVIQLSSKLLSGFSGSPIINMNGEAVGMVTMSLDSDIAFALPINEIRLIAEHMLSGDGVTKVLLGIKGSYVKDMRNYEKTNLNLSLDVLEGLYVEKIRDNSLAYQAGLRSQDVIVSINGIAIGDFDDYLSIVYTNERSFDFAIIRNGENLQLQVSGND